jgi:hypothetical protein
LKVRGCYRRRRLGLDHKLLLLEILIDVRAI